MREGQESFLSKNMLGILSFVFSMATAVGASWTMQVRHDERITAQQVQIKDLQDELKDKVDQREFQELKTVLVEMKTDIKDLLKAQAQGRR